MARTKVGLDYFELDCHMEEKVRLIQAEYGLKGFAIVVKLYQKIYGEFGYYCEWNEDSLLLFMSENGVSSREEKNLIDEIVNACIRRGIFSDEVFKKYGVLTSVGVQKAYLAATSRRENVKIEKAYLLLPDGKIPDNVDIIEDNVDIIEYNVDILEQSRVDKSRVDKSRVDKSRVYLTVSKDTVCSTDVQRVVDAWNELQEYGITPVSRISTGSERYKLLIARIREYNTADVLEAISKIKNSDFLCGRNRKGWSIKFDWFVLPNNFPKVLEGNYDNNQRYDDGNDNAAGKPISGRKQEQFNQLMEQIRRDKENENRRQ